MCAKFTYLVLGSLFVFVVATVASFVYLEWWQAILASLGTFLLLVYIAKQVIRSTFRNLRKAAEGMFTKKSATLRGATVEVHAVRPATLPEEVRDEMRQVIDADDSDDSDDEAREALPDYVSYQWCEVEATVFPQAGDTATFAAWDVESLVLVPIDATKLEFLNGDDSETPQFDLLNVRVVADGAMSEPVGGGGFAGPQRLRFTVGVPRGTRLLKFQYFFEQFGRVELPSTLGLPPAKPR